jgi:uncharacterized delta-60 repeat protein
MNVLKVSAGVLCAALALVCGSVLAVDGQPDPTFGTAGFAYLSADGVTGHQLHPRAVVSRSDGRIIIGGSRNRLRDGSPDPERRPLLARLNADGSADSEFGDDTANPGMVVFDSFFLGTQEQEIEAILSLEDGSVVAVGTATAFGPTVGFVIKVDARGQLDGSFGNRGVIELPNSYLHALAMDGRGRFVVVGERVGGEPLYRGLVVRLLADGRFDDSFGNVGQATLFEPGMDQLGYLAALAIDAEDRILVGGQYQVPQAGLLDNYDLSIARFTTDGQLDSSFANAGWRRFNVDPTSDFDGIDRLLIDSDGKIVFAGFYLHHDEGGAENGTNIVLGRLDGNGATDPSFGTSNGYTLLDILPLAFNRYPSALIRDDQDRLLFSVDYAMPGKSNFVVMRVSADGIIDPAFGDGGKAEIDLAPQGIYSESLAMTVHQGQPLLAGSAMRTVGSPLVDLAVARVLNDSIYSSGFD